MKEIDSNHSQKRSVLRFLGVLCLIAGILCIGIAIVDFMGVFTSNSFETSMKGPSKFGLFFLGMPLLFVGSIMTGAGFMGAAARYQAEEIAPVGKDTVNYMVDGTKESIKEVSKAIHEGIKESELEQINGKFIKDTYIFCSKCGKKNVADADFCNGCGSKIVR